MSNLHSPEVVMNGENFFSPSQIQHKPLYTREGIKKGHKRFASTQNVDFAFVTQPVPQPHQERKRKHQRTQSNTALDFNKIIGINQAQQVVKKTEQNQNSQLSKIAEVPSPLNETPYQSKTFIQDSLEAQACFITPEKSRSICFKNELSELRENQLLLQNQYSQLLNDYKERLEQNEQLINQKVQEQLAEIIQSSSFRSIIQKITKEEKCQCNELTQAKVKISTLEKTVQSKDKEIQKLKAQLNSLTTRRKN